MLGDEFLYGGEFRAGSRPSSFGAPPSDAAPACKFNVNVACAQAVDFYGHPNLARAGIVL